MLGFLGRDIAHAYILPRANACASYIYVHTPNANFGAVSK